ncbi:MAG: hypothetical protein UHK60_13210 [Acutalibacteraceae bacterium]|nr:hypothetical protein [Acutalibacteraceae bacterium]
MFDSNKTWFCKNLKIEDAKLISKDLKLAIEQKNHAEATRLFQKVKKYMQKRINENYFSPVEKVNQALSKLDVPENTAFITMGINCILIELFFEIKNGLDASSDIGAVGNAYEEILPLLDSSILKDSAKKFYKGIRCGILHQGQTKDKTALTYQLETVFSQNGTYYLSNPQTVFNKLKELYQLYWREISEKNYSDEMAEKLIKKYNSILNHI